MATLRQLEYPVAIVEEGSFTRAAERLKRPGRVPRPHPRPGRDHPAVLRQPAAAPRPAGPPPAYSRTSPDPIAAAFIDILANEALITPAHIRRRLGLGRT
ncbi:MAG TPA: LysR family transcriptional regulator [Trebonia sp.]